MTITEVFIWFMVGIYVLAVSGRLVLLGMAQYPRVQKPISAAQDVVSLVVALAMLSWVIAIICSG